MWGENAGIIHPGDQNWNAAWTEEQQGDLRGWANPRGSEEVLVHLGPEANRC